MWITLLFIAQVGCEWVQISQQHYRKPYKPYSHHVLAEAANFDYEEDTTPETKHMYTNQTMNDYKWKDSDLPHKNKGFVTRVEADEDYIIRGDKKTGFTKVNNPYKNLNVNYHEEGDDILKTYDFKDNNHGRNKLDKVPINNKAAIISPKNPHSDQRNPVPHLKRYGPDIFESQEDVFEESYHIMPNIGSIKKVHLDSRTVRTPILKEISKKPYGTSSSHNIKPPISDKETSPSRPVIIWKSENQTMRIIPGVIQKVSKEDLERRPVENISRYEEIPLNEEDHSKIKNIFMTHVKQSSEEIFGESAKFNQLPDINFEKPVFVTKEEFEDEGLVTISTVDSTAGSEEKATESITKSTTETPKPKIENKTKELPFPHQDKTNTMENVLKFMRIVTDTISRNTRKSVGSKVRYLENLQDTIMANIEHRINAMWPDDHPSGQPSRKARSADEPRGHVEFPSSESALMTISFLTFAVYLIKLVLQVIHTYKNKAMFMMPAVVTTVGRTFTAVYRRADAT